MSLCPKAVNCHCDHKVHDKLTAWKVKTWSVQWEKNIFKQSRIIMILKYLISYEKSEIQIILLIGLPWISQHVCTLLTCPIFHPMVSIKSWKLTAWIRSLSSASGSCQNGICHKAPLRTKYLHLSNQAKRSLSTHLTPVAWHLPSIQTHFMASAYGIWEISAKNCIQNCSVFRLILCGVKWTCGQFIYYYKWRRFNIFDSCQGVSMH